MHLFYAKMIAVLRNNVIGEARRRSALADAIASRVNNPVGDRWDLLADGTFDELRAAFVDWLWRNAWESGAHCSPSWGRTFSELWAYMVESRLAESGLVVDLHAVLDSAEFNTWRNQRVEERRERLESEARLKLASSMPHVAPPLDNQAPLIPPGPTEGKHMRIEKISPLSRTITTHRDGHGTQEKISIYTDQPDERDGAAHLYKLVVTGPQGLECEASATLPFQQGPKNDHDHKPGLTDAALLAVLIDRYRGFQSGPFACRENAIVLTHLETAALWIKARADDRARRGVLGTRQK